MSDSFEDWRARLVSSGLGFEDRRFYEFAISSFLRDLETQDETRPSRRAAAEFLERQYTEAVASDSDLDVWREALDWMFSEGGFEAAPGEVPDEAASSQPEAPDEVALPMFLGEEPEIAPVFEDEPSLPPLLRGGFERAASEHALNDRTARSYWNWLERFGRFTRDRTADLDDPEEVGPFLKHLGTTEQLAPQSCNQALIALKFIFRFVFQPGLELEITQVSKRKHVQVTLGRRELDQLFAVMEPELKLMCKLMYGAGLRTPELLELRVRDLDFKRQLLLAPSQSGKSQREAPMASGVLDDLRNHLKRVRAIFAKDAEDLEKFPGVELPSEVAKTNPELAHEWDWQWVFPSRNLTRDPATGGKRRHHWNAFTFQRGVKKATELAGIRKRVTPHMFRHSFATHLLQAGQKPKVVQKLMGHRTLETTMSYVNAIKLQQENAPVSPLDL
ncbi:MAG: site-specific recombinase XerD [Verrucomicrobiales bacterium]